MSQPGRISSDVLRALTNSSGFRYFIEECLVQLFLKSQDVKGAGIGEAFGSLEQLPPRECFE